MEDDWNRRQCGATEDGDLRLNKSFNISFKRKKKNPDLEGFSAATCSLA